MDVHLLSRIQFTLTIAFHFLFPPLSIGLAWLLTVIEWRAWRRRCPIYDQTGRFFGKVLALTFVVGVATGIPMEFQFGMNWSRYSRMVGDIFGAPLAAEGVLAFFLESAFLGLYLFGRHRISKGWQVFAIFMVAVGATLSAFWIIVANSWMQTPAGFTMNNGRAELTDFMAAVFNPSTIHRYGHTVLACVVSGAFFMAGLAAYLLRRNAHDEVARAALRVSVPIGLVSALLVAFPSGHEHARQVARTQPAKFAAIEGLYTSQSKAPLVMFALPFDKPPTLKANIEVPGLLSWMAFGSIHAHVQGINEFPVDERPPLWLTFVSFHNMVILGTFFILAMGYASWLLWRNRLWQSRKLLRVLVWSLILPLMACQLGWMAAEVGRQPWIVYPVKDAAGQVLFGGMRTSEAFSTSLTVPQVLFSIACFTMVYLLLCGLFIFLLKKKLNDHAAKVGADGIAHESATPAV